MLKEDVKIYSQNNEGMGIGKIDNIVTFVPFTLPNEVVDVIITEQNKNYYNGFPKKLKSMSIERREIKCPYYYRCGGCNILHQKYEYQLNFKKQKVIDNLMHIGKININCNIEIVSGEEYYYRNHITLSILNDKIGFYMAKTNDIININECIISNKKINEIIKNIKQFLKKYPDNNIDKISIKAYNETQINIMSNDFKLINEFKKYVNTDSLYLNNEYVCGLKRVPEYLNNYKFYISCNSFFQKNTKMAEKLYDYIKENVNENDKVLDLYCGTGSIGIYVSEKAKNILGIEIKDEAIEDAKLNAIENNANNIEFICGKTDNALYNIKKIDTIIVDPPRVGLSNRVKNYILKINPKNIIYVSCDSVTLARDLKTLTESYNIKEIKLFDLFPNTYHVECVAILHRKTL